MENKSIIYIGQFIPPSGNAIAQRVRSNAVLLKTVGYSVILIGCKYGICKTIKTKDSLFETYVTPYPNNLLSWIKRCISIREYLKIINNYGDTNIELVISCDLQCIAQNKLRRKLKKRKIKYVEDTMEWISFFNFQNLRTIIRNIDTYFRMTIEHIRTHNIICISKFMYDYYKSKNCNIIQLPVLIDYNDSKWDIKEKYIPNKIRRIVYAGNIGRIVDKERIDIVIEEACNLYADGKAVCIEIIGMSKSEFAKQCPDIANNKYFDMVALFQGKQTHEFCLQRIASADASILIRENSFEMKAGFPTKLSESLRLGVPPLITIIGDYDRYITNNQDCIVLNDTSNLSVKQAIEKIYYISDEQLIKMHLNCKNNRTFDYHNYLNDVIQFIRHVQI